VAGLGWIYATTAAVLGALFTAGCAALLRDPTPKRSMRLFGFSITYVTILFASIAVDVLVGAGW
jgi:protoheme IX farnesyltransferase